MFLVGIFMTFRMVQRYKELLRIKGFDEKNVFTSLVEGLFLQKWQKAPLSTSWKDFEMI
jgi:hypothetical protein